MLVRCPQCQFANQVEADATKPRIVCARCATVISIEFLGSPSTPPASDHPVEVPLPAMWTAEQIPSEPSFMKTPESPLDLDSLLEPPLEAVATQPLSSPPAAGPVSVPTSAPLPPPPVESRWDSDEILDIPRAGSTETYHDPLAVEDLLSAPAGAEAVSYSQPAYTESSDAPLHDLLEEPLEETPSAATTRELWGEPIAPAEPSTTATSEYQTEPYSPAELLEPESAQDAAASATSSSVFEQDSYIRNPSSTFVMATPDSGNRGRLAKIFLVAALAFALIGVGYFALSGLIKDWLGIRRNQEVVSTQGATGTAGAATGNPGTTPSAAPSLGAKVSPSESSKTESPSPTASASPSATASAKPSASAAASPSASTKPSPTPAGSSGHAVGSGDGSLTLQVGAYKTPGEAQARISKLKSSNVEARMVKADVPGKGVFYRVQIGRFTTEGDASKYAGELRAKGVVQDFIISGYQNQ